MRGTSSALPGNRYEQAADLPGTDKIHAEGSYIGQHLNSCERGRRLTGDGPFIAHWIQLGQEISAFRQQHIPNPINYQF